MEDTLWQGLIDQQINMPMGITAENLAEKYGITRQQCDEFAVRSNQRWKAGEFLPVLCYEDKMISTRSFVTTFLATGVSSSKT
jgi:Thiolase, N-terminal domain